MSSYTISNTKLNPNRVFLLQKSELEKRLDPFYYIPELVELEKKVLSKQPKRLRDYVKGIASGATPKTAEVEKYYSDAENGKPFLRVQNLSATGILEFNDCKYINEETHNGMLKRSQVSEGDLLVKITGVGRMAIASVAPENFEGNINQHVCVIKTGSKEISETLAAYLNSDIAEKLASRRSTGGTRPALDYPALLSIPIIEDKRILEITKRVVEQKEQNEAEAERLLSSINDYLFSELGIVLPLKENSLQNRIFKSSLIKLSGKRFDCDYYSAHYTQLEKAIENSKYTTEKINSVVTNIASGKTAPSSDYSKEKTDYPIIKVGSYTKEYIDLNKVDFTNTSNSLEAQKGDIFILSAAHQAEYVGRHIKYLNENPKIPTSYVGELICVRVTNDKCNSMYLFSLLNTDIFKTLINREKTGQTSHIYGKDIKHIKIPIPPIDKQNEIAEHILEMREQAQKLKDKTAEALKEASEEIERTLIGN